MTKPGHTAWRRVRGSLLGCLLAVFTYAPTVAIAGATEDWQTAYDAELAGEYDLAIHHYTRAIQSGELTQTGLSRVFRSRGNVHLSGNNLDSALKDFDTSISLDPTYHLAYVSRGVVYHERQSFGQALDDYDQAIMLDPNYALSYANRGGAYEQLEQIDEAVLDFQKAYELGYREDWLIEVLTAYDALP